MNRVGEKLRLQEKLRKGETEPSWSWVRRWGDSHEGIRTGLVFDVICLNICYSVEGFEAIQYQLLRFDGIREEILLHLEWDERLAIALLEMSALIIINWACIKYFYGEIKKYYKKYFFIEMKDGN